MSNEANSERIVDIRMLMFDLANHTHAKCENATHNIIKKLQLIGWFYIQSSMLLRVVYVSAVAH